LDTAIGKIGENMCPVITYNVLGCLTCFIHSSSFKIFNIDIIFYSLGDQQAQQPVLHAISKFREEIGAIQIKTSVKQAVVASGVPI
jgi:hypothetical protein